MRFDITWDNPLPRHIDRLDRFVRQVWSYVYDSILLNPDVGLSPLFDVDV